MALALVVAGCGVGVGTDETGTAGLEGRTEPSARAPVRPIAAEVRLPHQERQAAAERAKTAGFEMVAPGQAMMHLPDAVAPRYFSVPNYANSPLHGWPDAHVRLEGGGGMGARAAALVDHATGAITAIEVLEPGMGYTTPPTVTIAPWLPTTAPTTAATALATIDDDPASATFGQVTGVTVTAPGAGYLSPGIEKFVDPLPLPCPETGDEPRQCIPVAKPDTTTYPGSDYYEIAVVEFEEQMHRDLPPTKLRGYVQLETELVAGRREALPGGHFGVRKPHYMGPLIAATRGRPVRVLFRNLLPAGTGGDLFLPVDTTVMGAGMGPTMDHGHVHDPLRPMCSARPKPMGCFTENRATVHLHGGVTPWISDGTPHQWITPAAEDPMLYPVMGASVQNVPDMPDPGPGAMTFYFPNQQSARLMFYHDHSWGITRLNVYAGEAAPYVITDDTEQALIEDGLIPDASATLPLVIQDKTFVPSEQQLAHWDPLWDLDRWGEPGDLWLPHVYSPAQNPGDEFGVNQFGRWAYGPWFWPPTIDVAHGPVPNPYFDETCDPDQTWCEPPLMPGVPFNSMGMEAFMDTPVVNGTAYPKVTLEPKAYRFRILNAANDRFFNLSLYEADPNAPTEVALDAAEVAAALEDPAGIFPTPDTAISPAGPSWIQIATEGGFLPAPVEIPAQPITWVTDPTVFNAGNVDGHSLLLGPAERADVIVDLSAHAGKTLILYNDAPAAFPARDPRYDYYTGNADHTETGGTPPTPPGYGPNTRTVMQIQVAATTPAPAFDLAALEAAFAHQADGSGVFESGQHPIIVGQGAYNSAYGTTFKHNGPENGTVQIFQTWLKFKTVGGGELTLDLRPKQIQDEMGEAFEQAYGRMSGFLGVETPNPRAGMQNMILYGFMHPPTEVIDATLLPRFDPELDVTPLGSAEDGTQIWKVTHNGVDTHPVHFHLFEVQLLNRVGWDGIIRKPDPNELGWKDTVRMSPLEDTIVALRPVIPTVPFDVPNSVRLLDPSMPDGAWIANSTAAEAAGMMPLAFAPNGEPIDIVNHLVNYGWEYVWHCHILSHEEMDMMRPIAVAMAPRAPDGLVGATFGGGRNKRVQLAWFDRSVDETAFEIQRATAPDGEWSVLTTLPSTTGAAMGGLVTWSDEIGNTNQTFFYRVRALNVVGDTWDYSDPELNEGATFPTVTAVSDFTAVTSSRGNPPAPPADVTAAISASSTRRVTVTWTDASADEAGFRVEWARDPAFTVGLGGANVGADATSYTTGNLSRNTDYYFRVQVQHPSWEVPPVNATPFPIRPY